MNEFQSSEYFKSFSQYGIKTTLNNLFDLLLIDLSLSKFYRLNDFVPKGIKFIMKISTIRKIVNFRD